MNAVQFIRLSLESSKQWLMAIFDGIKDAPLTQPTPRGGNHPLWNLGHLAYSEAHIVSQFILGEQNPLLRWKELFGAGSEPVADASRYPSVDEVLREFERVRAGTLQVLSSLTDADLDRPSKAPADRQQMFGTIGQCLSAVSLHSAFHTGQIADARRAAGRKPVIG